AKHARPDDGEVLFPREISPPPFLEPSLFLGVEIDDAINTGGIRCLILHELLWELLHFLADVPVLTHEAGLQGFILNYIRTAVGRALRNVLECAQGNCQER